MLRLDFTGPEWRSWCLLQQFRKFKICIHNIVIAKHAKVYLGAQAVIIIIINLLPTPLSVFSNLFSSNLTPPQSPNNSPRKFPSACYQALHIIQSVLIKPHLTRKIKTIYQGKPPSVPHATKPSILSNLFSSNLTSPAR